MARTEPKLLELIEKPRLTGNRVTNLPPKVKQARQLEQMRRASRTRWMVLKAMSRLYPEDFTSLMTQANAYVAKERGPLPGDK